MTCKPCIQNAFEMLHKSEQLCQIFLEEFHWNILHCSNFKQQLLQAIWQYPFLVFLKNVFHIRDMKGTWILVGACSVIYCRGKREIDCDEKLMYLALRLNKVISLRLFLYVDHLSHATEWDSFKWQHIVLQFYILETMQICVAYLAAKHDWPDLTASLVASFDLKQSM